MRITRLVLLISLLALIVVPAAWALRFTDESYFPAVGETGKPYNWSFTGAGGCGPALPYQFKILDGSLPSGLTLATSGLVSGTPKQAGEYSFWIQLSDENPPSADWCVPKTAERYMTMRVIPGLNIVQNSLSPKGAFVNQPYSFQLTTDNPGASVTWSVASGTLPAGLSLNSSSGLISGTPTATGDFSFKIQVKDAGTRSDAETYSLSIVPKLEIASAKALAEVGQLYQLTPQATGGKQGYTWALSADSVLPAGLTFDPATGAISGRPTTPGKSTAKLVVTDSLGLPATLGLAFNVAPHILIAKKPLPAAKAGQAYDTFIKAVGGFRPRIFEALGALPSGLKLNKRTGELSGTPKKAGTYRFRIQVTDGLYARSAAGFALKVASA